MLLDLVSESTWINIDFFFLWSKYKGLYVPVLIPAWSLSRRVNHSFVSYTVKVFSFLSSLANIYLATFLFFFSGFMC